MVVEVEAELDPLVEGDLRLPGAVHVARVPALHRAGLVVQHRLYHTVTDGLEGGSRW